MVNLKVTKDAWMGAARRALLKGGRGAVRVDRLADDLGVTKGSFYHYFADVSALLDALLIEWEAEDALLEHALDLPRPVGLAKLIERLAERVVASEHGDLPSDAAIFAWAAVDPVVADRVSIAEERRLGLLAQLMGGRDRAELAYMSYLGFVLRRRRAADHAANFKLVGDFWIHISSGAPISGPVDVRGRDAP